MGDQIETPVSGVRPKLRRVLTLVAKFILVVLLIVWMVRTARLDLRDVSRTLSRWPAMMVVTGLCYASYFIAAARWKLLLVQQGIQVSMRDVFALSMIGALFNSAIPGAVSGVVKAYYISARCPEKESQAVTTIFLDRIAGLTSLLLLAAVAGVWNFGSIARHGKVAVLYWTVVVAAFTGVTLPLATPMMSGRMITAAERLAQRFPVLKPVMQAVRATTIFYSSPRTLTLALVTSLVGQLGTCFAFYVLGASIGAQSIQLSRLFFVVPLGLAAMALPIAPAGLGVGQVVFYSLFSELLPGMGPIGASMVTIYQLVYVFVSLTGMFFYFRETAIRKSITLAGK